MTIANDTIILVNEREEYRDGHRVVNDPREVTEYMKWLKRRKNIQRGKGLYRGEAIVGTKPYKDPLTGRTSLGEVWARKHNMVLMAGTLYGLEKMFNTPSSLSVEYLNNIMGIGVSGPEITEKYRKEHAVCLWSIGNGACGDSYLDVKSALQQHRTLQGMIPFRVVDEPFQEGTPEYDKYWFRKTMDDGKSQYFLKAFEGETNIAALWKDAGNNKDGSPVVPNDYTSTRKTPIETFSESILKLEKEDLIEYYTLMDQLREARFNTFGLCTGIKGVLSNGMEEYKQVLQVTALSFGNELLHMGKDLTIIYRWYTA